MAFKVPDCEIRKVNGKIYGAGAVIPNYTEEKKEKPKEEQLKEENPKEENPKVYESKRERKRRREKNESIKYSIPGGVPEKITIDTDRN